MPKPRKQQISLDATPYYHCMSRCVRRAFLCGQDQLTGQCFEHRRGWIENKALELAEVFAIDIAAYAIMSNYYHLVLFIDSEKAKSWSELDVIIQWHKLFKGNGLSQRFLNKLPMSEPETNQLSIWVEEWRSRLMDISWFMRLLNESIARKANQEDNCKGRFWESRFKSQALLDETALMACLAYVDLNPIRAGISDTPEQSDYTSVKERCKQAQKSEQKKKNPNHLKQQTKGLHPFIVNPKKHLPNKGIQMPLTDYLELVDWTGRIQRTETGKQGVIPDNTQAILTRLNINPQQWLNISQSFETSFKQFAGKEENLRQAAKQFNYQRTSGIKQSRQAMG